MVINWSVLGQAPFSVSISVVGISLVMLFTAMAPESSAGLEFWQRLLFWTTQVSISLLGILLASVLIRRLATIALSDIWLILITGIIASLVVSPAFVLIENLFTELDRTPDSVLDEFAETGLLPALLVQSIETMPALTISWFLVNLPILLNSTFISQKTSEKGPDNEPPNPVESQQHQLNHYQARQQSDKTQFFLKLPTNIGTNIMYVSSDLHYLKVTTEQGSVLILGSITKFAEAFDEEGFLVHRSHWVNKAYVSRVVISASHSRCVMRDGSSIPISRSKRKLLKAYFGNNNTTNPNHNIDFNSQKRKY